jgi:hypothetical protein
LHDGCARERFVIPLGHLPGGIGMRWPRPLRQGGTGEYEYQ